MFLRSFALKFSQHTVSKAIERTAIATNLAAQVGYSIWMNKRANDIPQNQATQNPVDNSQAAAHSMSNTAPKLTSK